MKLTILNSIYTVSFFSLAISESVISSMNTNVTLMNDMTRCFFITMAILNFIMGIGSMYMVCLFFISPKSERYALHISSGTSIWGLILYFRYHSMLLSVFQYVLLAEIIFFFIRVIVMIVIICYSCKPVTELGNVVTN